MKLNEKQKSLVDNLIFVARKRGYRDETIEILIMLTCTSQMIDTVGSADKATQIIIELIESCDSPQECVSKTLQIAGIE